MTWFNLHRNIELASILPIVPLIRYPFLNYEINGRCVLGVECMPLSKDEAFPRLSNIVDGRCALARAHFGALAFYDSSSSCSILYRSRR